MANRFGLNKIYLLILASVAVIFIYFFLYAKPQPSFLSEKECLEILSSYDNSIKDMNFEFVEGDTISYKFNRSERIEPYFTLYNKTTAIYYLNNKIVACTHEIFELSNPAIIKDFDSYNCSGKIVLIKVKDYDKAYLVLLANKTNESGSYRLSIGYFDKSIGLNNFFDLVKECVKS